MNRPDRDDPESRPAASEAAASARDAADVAADLQDMLIGAAENDMDPVSLTEAFTALSVALAAPPGAADQRARLLSAAASPEHRFAPFLGRFAGLIDVAHQRARELLASLARPETWEAFLPGVELVHLEGGPACAGADVGFVRVKAGETFPTHHHIGRERVLVLQGGYTDSTGAVVRAGDLVELPGGSSHSLTARPGPDLIYAVVVFGVDIPGAPSLHKD